jgi:Flp pilus assembly protein CpaB
MRRGRTLILVLLIIIIGLVVGFVAIRQFVLAPPSSTEQAVYVDVYYAAQNIPQGGEITESVLATMRIPQENVVATMYTVDELPVLLTNKVAKYPIDQGTPLTESVVVDASSAVPISGPQWAALIPPGMTAMTIPTDRLSASGYAISDGAHVNINACLLFVDVDPSFQTALPNRTATLTGTGFPEEGGLPTLSLGAISSETPQGRLELDPSVQQPYYIIPSEAQRSRLVCQMLLQDVVVMKLGNFPLASETAATTAAETGADTVPSDAQQNPSTPPDIITLIVSPQDSITLSYLIYTNAKITLTLRNPSDQTRLATEASTLQFLLSQYNIPVPAKLPYAMQPALTDLFTPFLPNDVITVPAE